MQVFERVAAVRAATITARQIGRRIGFVPTMGALHAGHQSLMDIARRECDHVVASIFVNPTQFAPNEDLQKYPRPRDRDLRLCQDAGVDIVFCPAVEEMHPPGALTKVTVDELSSMLEGEIRPTHFQGVTTVVAKLFGIVVPDVAYFGQKDYQQQLILRKMVRDLNMPIEIRTVPTVRDANGLALSSRNAYLSSEERSASVCLSQALRLGESLAVQETDPTTIAEAMRQRIIRTPGVQLDYAVVADPGTLQALSDWQPHMAALVAARLGATRLIDNALWGPQEFDVI